MSALLPARPEIEPTDREPAMVGLDDDEAASVFETLSSRTARRVIARLYEDPATASEVAEAVDTSLQNATYHLSRLCEADLVTEAGTWYSSRGVEMTVYAPTSEPLLLVAGPDVTDDIEAGLAAHDPGSSESTGTPAPTLEPDQRPDDSAP